MSMLMNNLKIDKINGLVKKAFGDNFDGNYKLEDGFYGIVKKTRKFLFFMNRYIIVGLLENDGSSIEVFPGYAENAEKYAELYKETTGERAYVGIINGKNPKLF